MLDLPEASLQPRDVGAETPGGTVTCVCYNCDPDGNHKCAWAGCKDRARWPVTWWYTGRNLGTIKGVPAQVVLCNAHWDRTDRVWDDIWTY